MIFWSPLSPPHQSRSLYIYHYHHGVSCRIGYESYDVKNCVDALEWLGDSLEIGPSPGRRQRRILESIISCQTNFFVFRMQRDRYRT